MADTPFSAVVNFPTEPAPVTVVFPGPVGPPGPIGPPGPSGPGTGNVNGPTPPVVDGHVVFFNGTTGTSIKDSGLTLSGNNTGDQDLSSLVTIGLAAGLAIALG